MNRLRFSLALSLSLACSPMAKAVSYGVGIENSHWYLSGSIFECSITHDIPGFGRAVFYHQAGESLTFYLDSPRPLLRAGQAALVIEAPSWRPGVPVQDLGYVASRETPQAVSVETRRASIMMDSLLKGMAPTITRQARYQDQTLKVQLSPVNFGQVYREYLNCMAGLLPANFNQVERSVLTFESSDAWLSEAARKRLDLVVLYVGADPSVTGVVIDGHSDSYGHRITNRELSKQRAEAVAKYLIEAGINEEMITVRYHGDRYPVADNKTAANRARNRRATVKLERREPAPAQFQAQAGPSF